MNDKVIGPSPILPALKSFLEFQAEADRQRDYYLRSFSLPPDLLLDDSHQQLANYRKLPEIP